MFSPDGRWLAYMSNESGAYRVYAEAFPQKGHKLQISNDDTAAPAWSRNGNDLFFWHFGADNQIMSVSCKSRGHSLVTDKPRVWSRQIAWFRTTRSYDPAPDGKRIVVLMPADTSQEPRDRLIFLLNFFDELRRRVPVRAN